MIIVGRRRINYGAIDPLVSREIFIREALVEGDYHSKGDFQNKNRKLIAEVAKLEAKLRRCDILVDTEVLFRFYDERIPADVVNGAGFEKWRVNKERSAPDWLLLTRDYLMRYDAEQVTEAHYPDRILWDGLTLPLSYHFVPGDENDGVTVTVPVQALRLLPRYRFEWLVPGMLYDKAVALVRALPKALRKNFVPVPDFVRGALEAMAVCDEPLTNRLGQQLTRMAGVLIPDDAWNLGAIDHHFLMNFKVLDEYGQLLGQGRDLVALKVKFAQQAETSIRNLSSDNLEQVGLKDWSCGELPVEITRNYNGLTLTMYPALVDQKESVAVRLFENQAKAAKENTMGLVRLLRFRMQSQLKFALSKMPKWKEAQLLSTHILNRNLLEDDVQNLLILEAFLDSQTRPTDKQAFDHLVDQHKSRLVPLAESLDGLLNQLFRLAHHLAKQLKGKNISLDRALSMADVKQQIARLLKPGFMQEAGLEWLNHYPRYMKAIDLRLEKLPAQVNKDRAWTEELASLQKSYEARLASHNQHQLVDDKLTQYYWMLEEYRVSLFAQQLGTRFPVSDKRLKKLWKEVQII